MVQSSEAAVSEHRVGRLLVREPRAAQDGWVEIRRESLESPTGAFRSRFAWMALLAIAVGLIGFSARVGSFPGLGIGVILVALLAGIAIFRGRRPSSLVRIADAQVSIVAPAGATELPLDDIERLGVGRDMDPLHTVWVAVRGKGRLLLLDGLTVEEAEVAASRLRPFVPTAQEEAAPS